MRFAEAAALAEGRVFEIFGVDAQAGGDVVADEAEPGELLGGESGSGILPPEIVDGAMTLVGDNEVELLDGDGGL